LNMMLVLNMMLDFRSLLDAILDNMQ